MTILQSRYSKQDLLQLFVFCAFPIHIWSIIFELQEIPSMLLYFSNDEIIGSLAYNMTFTLIETILVYLLVLTIGIGIGKTRFGDYYVTLCSIIISEIVLLRMIFELLINRSYSGVLLITLTILLLLLTILIVPRYPKLKDQIQSISSRLTVLTYLYVLIDLVGVFIIIARNM